jgi:transmembrane sensor
MNEPSRYVQPTVSDARVERLWLGVAERLEARPARSFRWWLSGGIVAAALAGGVLLLKMPPTHAVAPSAVLGGAKLETKTDELAVTLADGSRVELAAASAVQVSGDASASATLLLSRGQLTCDVVHREGRRFAVVAGDVEVRVIGTKFSVKTSSGPSPRVEVAVLRGVVEIESRRRPGIVARVAAGQSWIQELESAPSPVAAPSISSAPEPPVAPKRDAPSTPSNPPTGPSARELFEKATASRRAGDAAAAAQAYVELLRAHPSDARAGLAAFELGRLRMDRLQDPAGAVAALERAVAMNIGPSFREDGLARLVSVYAAQGNFAACTRLSSYPSGVHAGAVTSRCGSR